MSPITPDPLLPGTVLEGTLRRDRRVVLAALFGLTVIAWIYLVWLAQGMAMPAAGMTGMARAWTPGEFALMFFMWAVMMIGMMTPSAAPMILIYARIGRQAALEGKPLAATGFFAAGYLLAWTVFSLAATAAQWGLHRALLLTPMMASASAVFSGAVLIAAGVYQWTPAKRTCLRHCQTPLFFIQNLGGFRRDALGSLALGFHHGLYCIGCCWALMALLFVVGVMNLAWVAVLTVLVVAEKLVAPRWHLDHAVGLLLFAAGGWLACTVMIA